MNLLDLSFLFFKCTLTVFKGSLKFFNGALKVLDPGVPIREGGLVPLDGALEFLYSLDKVPICELQCSHPLVGATSVSPSS